MEYGMSLRRIDQVSGHALGCPIAALQPQVNA